MLTTALYFLRTLELSWTLAAVSLLGGVAGICVRESCVSVSLCTLKSEPQNPKSPKRLKPKGFTLNCSTGKLTANFIETNGQLH